MKVISNDITVEWEQWDDPGDYPSNAGAGPLPSWKYETTEGTIVLFLTVEEYARLPDCDATTFANELYEEDVITLPDRVESVTEWEYQGPPDGGPPAQAYTHEGVEGYCVEIYPTNTTFQVYEEPEPEDHRDF